MQLRLRADRVDRSGLDDRARPRAIVVAVPILKIRGVAELPIGRPRLGVQAFDNLLVAQPMQEHEPLTRDCRRRRSPVPLVRAQTRGGGSLRLSFVSVDIALCVGPRKAAQSCVTASLASGFAFEPTWVCAPASLVASGFTVKARNIARRDMRDMQALCELPDGRDIAHRLGNPTRIAMPAQVSTMMVRLLVMPAVAIAVAIPAAQTFRTSADLVTIPLVVTSRRRQ